jgi:hypothetical protein
MTSTTARRPAARDAFVTEGAAGVVTEPVSTRTAPLGDPVPRSRTDRARRPADPMLLVAVAGDTSG